MGGKPLAQLMEERPDTYGALDLKAIADAGRGAGWTILGGKGSTEFGIGASIAEVVRAIFGDENRVLPVSVLLNGEYGQHGVHCGVPCRIGRTGIEQVIQLELTQEEQRQLDISCQVIKKHIDMAAAL